MKSDQKDIEKHLAKEIVLQSAEGIENYAIVFQNLCLTYDDEATAKKKFALKDLNLRVKRGEKVAFVGRTGKLVMIAY